LHQTFLYISVSGAKVDRFCSWSWDERARTTKWIRAPLFISPFCLYWTISVAFSGRNTISRELTTNTLSSAPCPRWYFQVTWD
jgi:hypothetical protein